MRPLRTGERRATLPIKEGPVVRVQHPDGEHSAIASIARDECRGAPIGFRSAVYAPVFGRRL